MERLHTKQVAYAILSIIALAASMFFAARAALVYNTFFFAFSHDAGVSITFAFIAFIVITGLSFFISTHWNKSNKLHWIVAGIVVIHDVGGMLYVMYAHQTYNWNSVQVWITQIAVTVAVCLISTCPVFLGLILEQMKPELQPEREALFQEWVDNFDMLLKRKGAELYEQLTCNPEVLIHHAPEKLRRVLADKGMTLVVESRPRKYFSEWRKPLLVASVGEIEEKNTPSVISDTQYPTTMLEAPVSEAGKEPVLPDILEEPVDIFEKGDVILNFPKQVGNTQEVQGTPPARHYLNQSQSKQAPLSTQKFPR